ncbi:MAG: hypothetical protein ACK5PS_03515 [Desulfopila sp.]
MKKTTTILRASVCLVALLGLFRPDIGTTAEPSINPHGLSPAGDMAFIPKLGALRNKSYRNGKGEKKSLSEAIVLRQSRIQDGKATVPAGGLFYLSETSGDASPLAGDPFLILGEHAILVDLTSVKKTVHDFSVQIGKKALIEGTGYRIWYDYSTDHYEKPYAEMALMSPSGGFPLEFPIATVFGKREAVRDLDRPEGLSPQLEEFYLDPEYFYGASYFKAREVTAKRVDFDTVSFPLVTKATFAMSRPIILDVIEEDYRFYLDKRIYAFRQPDGFLVRVTNFTGSEVLAEKLIKPVTAQGYKTRESEKDNYQLTVAGEDMRVEVHIHPSALKNSDFVPWHTGKSHGFQQGHLNFVVYRNLVEVESGKPWPLDERYNVVLEAHPKTGMLQRFLLENNQSFTLDNGNGSYLGPVKWSHVYNRPAFKVVASGFAGKNVHELYVRDHFYNRTENMVFFPQDGRINLDFFVGSSSVLEPIMEMSFLTRLADPSFGTVAEGNHFSSYPKVISDASFYEPDHTAPFAPRLRGLMRKGEKNRYGDRLISSESIFIRGSYVDWQKGKIIIPPAGLCYSSRNARNIRSLHGDSFFMLGKQAYLTSFTSGTFVKKNFEVDFWKNQPMGDGHLMYWQDELLGVRNKALRFTNSFYLDDRPVSELSLMKYSGNRWGAHFYLAQGLDRGERYYMPEIFAEGSTYIIPEYTGSNFAKLQEFATPNIENIAYTYEKPEKHVLGAAESAQLGKYTLLVGAVDTAAKTVAVQILDGERVVAEKTLGPLDEYAVNHLPQHMETARKMQIMHEDVQAELDIRHPFEGDKAILYTFTGIRQLDRDTAFEFDSRFMVRPDVCGHCYQFNELLLDNPEPIVLDKDNRVYEGPKREDGSPLFRIVIDSFDGEMIHAWHIETDYKKKTYSTDNLAFRPRDNVDALVGVTGTIEGFLRLSMLPRLAFMESWRTSAKGAGEKISGSVNTGGSAYIKR